MNQAAYYPLEENINENYRQVHDYTVTIAGASKAVKLWIWQ